MSLAINLNIMKQGILLGTLTILLWQLAILVWLFFPHGELKSAEIETPKQMNIKSASFDIRSVVALNLFGYPQKVGRNSRQGQDEKQISAPETSLNLKLRGLRKGQGNIKSSAIIEDSRGVQNIYYLGDNIQGQSQVSIYEIYSQRLILKRSGKYETLTLFDVLKKTSKSETSEEKVKIITAPQKANVPVIDKTRNGELTKSLAEISNKLQSNPLSLNGTMIIEPAEDDSGFLGYKVSPGRDRVLFARLGLVKGDVVTQVNDVELNSSGKIMSLMGALSSSDELNIQVMRRGQPLAFRYKVK